jgi:MSHA biogenesis protein MshQ
VELLGTGDVTGIESVTVGRFTPDHFDASPNTPQLSTAAGAGGFTYVGQSFDYASGSEPAVTARSVQGSATGNYTSTWFKITTASLTSRTYASASGTLAVGAPNAPNISDAGGGIGIVTFDTGPTLSMLRTSPVAPFDAEIALSFDLLDTDGVAWTGVNAFGQASAGAGIAFDYGKEMRFGRIALSSAHGSEILTLQVPLRAEYFDGSTFMSNAADAFTLLSTSDLNLTLNPGGLATSPSIVNSPLVLGDAGLRMSSPGVGNTGTADLVYDLSSAGLSHLLFDWDGDLSHDDDPTARVTFGVSTGDDPVIFMRELH